MGIAKTVGCYCIPGCPIIGAPELCIGCTAAATNVQVAGINCKSADQVTGCTKATRIHLCPRATIPCGAPPDLRTRRGILDRSIQRPIEILQTGHAGIISCGQAIRDDTHPRATIPRCAPPDLRSSSTAVTTCARVQRIAIYSKRADGAAGRAYSIPGNLIPAGSVRGTPQLPGRSSPTRSRIQVTLEGHHADHRRIGASLPKARGHDPRPAGAVTCAPDTCTIPIPIAGASI